MDSPRGLQRSLACARLVCQKDARVLCDQTMNAVRSGAQCQDRPNVPWESARPSPSVARGGAPQAVDRGPDRAPTICATHTSATAARSAAWFSCAAEWAYEHGSRAFARSPEVLAADPSPSSKAGEPSVLRNTAGNRARAHMHCTGNATSGLKRMETGRWSTDGWCGPCDIPFLRSPSGRQ